MQELSNADALRYAWLHRKLFDKVIVRKWWMSDRSRGISPLIQGVVRMYVALPHTYVLTYIVTMIMGCTVLCVCSLNVSGCPLGWTTRFLSFERSSHFIRLHDVSIRRSSSAVLWPLDHLTKMTTWMILHKRKQCVTWVYLVEWFICSPLKWQWTTCTSL